MVSLNDSLVALVGGAVSNQMMHALDYILSAVDQIKDQMDSISDRLVRACKKCCSSCLERYQALYAIMPSFPVSTICLILQDGMSDRNRHKPATQLLMQTRNLAHIFKLLRHELEGQPYMTRGGLDKTILEYASCEKTLDLISKYDPSADRNRYNPYFEKLVTKVQYCRMRSPCACEQICQLCLCQSHHYCCWRWLLLQHIFAVHPFSCGVQQSHSCQFCFV